MYENITHKTLPFFWRETNAKKCMKSVQNGNNNYEI